MIGREVQAAAAPLPPPNTCRTALRANPPARGGPRHPTWQHLLELTYVSRAAGWVNRGASSGFAPAVVLLRTTTARRMLTRPTQGVPVTLYNRDPMLWCHTEADAL